MGDIFLVNTDTSFILCKYWKSIDTFIIRFSIEMDNNDEAVTNFILYSLPSTGLTMEMQRLRIHDYFDTTYEDDLFSP